VHFAVSHVTTYRYSAPIRLGPHLLRLAPRNKGRFDLEVTPAPVSRTELTDDWGNHLIQLDFVGETEIFRIASRFVVATEAPAALRPVDTPPVLPSLPWPQNGEHTSFQEGPDPGPEVRRFAASLATSSDSALDFLDALNVALYARTDRHIRPDGYAKTAAETLATGRGACRDLTELFIAAARSQGIPARFASGYQARSESPDGRRHLHAWPEVWLPGLGWRGYDPTHGLPVTDGHVAIAVAPGQADTMPIEGSFWGGAITSTLEYDITIDARG